MTIDELLQQGRALPCKRLPKSPCVIQAGTH